MEQSILKSVKKVLGVDPTDTSFDLDILTHINSTFSTLQQLGIGPEPGFMIEDDVPTWEDFVGTDPRTVGHVRTYTFLKVRMLFDPPQTSYLIGALEKQIEELEWRMNQFREQTAWVDPDPPDMPEDQFGDPLVLDGGDA